MLKTPEVRKFTARLLCLIAVFGLLVVAPVQQAKADLPYCGDGYYWGWDGSQWGCLYMYGPGSYAIPGTGGDGWPPMCNSEGIFWYWYETQVYGYVDPDAFLAQFGCYPY